MRANRRLRDRRLLGASLAVGALVSLVPSAGLALGAFEAPLLGSERPALFTPASVDPQLARFMAERNGGVGRLKRFTPAGADGRPGRSVTVAVRVNAEEARAISLRSAIETVQNKVSDTSPGVRIASTRYNLGLSRGYQNFAQAEVAAPVLSSSLSEASIPNLSEFKPSRGVAPDESRFAARVVDDKVPAVAADLGPTGAVAEQTLDVAGSYRLTRNLDVTAGVRYSQDRDRLAPLRRTEQQDSQAVYIGTQFRF